MGNVIPESSDKTIRFENSGTYVGEVDKGVRSGSGLMLFNDGSRYEGQWYNDKRCGSGLMFSADGSAYCGQFWEDYEFGRGVLSILHESIMHGQFKGKSIAACGVHTNSNSVFIGPIEDGKRHGRGLSFQIPQNMKQKIPKMECFVETYQHGSLLFSVRFETTNNILPQRTETDSSKTIEFSNNSIVGTLTNNFQNTGGLSNRACDWNFSDFEALLCFLKINTSPEASTNFSAMKAKTLEFNFQGYLECFKEGLNANERLGLDLVGRFLHLACDGFEGATLMEASWDKYLVDHWKRQVKRITCCMIPSTSKAGPEASDHELWIPHLSKLVSVGGEWGALQSCSQQLVRTFATSKKELVIEVPLLPIRPCKGHVGRNPPYQISPSGGSLAVSSSYYALCLVSDMLETRQDLLGSSSVSSTKCSLLPPRLETGNLLSPARILVQCPANVRGWLRPCPPQLHPRLRTLWAVNIALHVASQLNSIHSSHKSAVHGRIRLEELLVGPDGDPLLPPPELAMALLAASPLSIHFDGAVESAAEEGTAEGSIVRTMAPSRLLLPSNFLSAKDVHSPPPHYFARPLTSILSPLLTTDAPLSFSTGNLSPAASGSYLLARELSFLSPETLLGREPVMSRANDLYALGLLIWEVSTGMRVFDGWTPHQIFTACACGHRVSSPNAVLDQSHLIGAELSVLVALLTHPSPERRFHIGKVVQVLEMLKMLLGREVLDGVEVADRWRRQVRTQMESMGLTWRDVSESG